MKKIIVPVVIWLFAFVLTAGASKPQLLMRNSVFKDNNNMPYVETQFSILSASINPVKQSNKKFKATYNINILYLNNQDDTIEALHYRLHTPELNLANEVSFDLADVRRVNLTSGKYRIELMVEDANSHQFEILSERISVYFPLTEVCFSDIMFLDNYTPASASSIFIKGGYEVLPYAVNVFPSNKSNLIFYQEIYNTSSLINDSVLFIQFQIRNLEGKTLEQYTYTYKEVNTSPVPILGNIDIQNLAAGQYLLHIEVHKKNTEVLASHSTYFIRTRQISSKGTDQYSLTNIEGTFAEQLHKDSLFYWLESLTPIATFSEKENIQYIIKQKDTINARKFFFAFWHHIAPADEEAEWLHYKADVEAAEYSFSTPIRHGFETDRGRVYLQYGKPDRRHVMNNEPGALPYEIWQYYRVPSGQTNVMFVFYLPSIATNDYRLIHSDVNGELRDIRWKYKIYASMKEMSGYANPDNTNIRDHWGKRIDQILNW